MSKQEPPNDPAQPSRRQFAGGVFAAASVVLLAKEPAIAAEKAAGPGTPPEGLSAADWDEVHARYASLLRVYGQRLSAEEKQHALRILTTNQHMLASIRTFAVQNGDPSACTLRVCDPDQMQAAAPSR